MFYISVDESDGKIYAGKVKHIENDMYEWEEREDCTSYFLAAMVEALKRSNKPFVINADGKPKFKIEMSELSEGEIKDIEALKTEEKPACQEDKKD